MNLPPLSRLCRRLVGAIMLAILCACSSLRPTATPPPSFYSLDAAAAPSAAAGAAISARPARAPAGAPTLIINPPHAAAGFDSQRIIYTRTPQQLEYFAHSEWVDPPARMLAPLLVAAAVATGAFDAVVPTPGAAAGDLRLDTEIVRLLQQFGSAPSQIRFTLRANLVDERTRRVLISREFDATLGADSDDPYGGVQAASRVVQEVLRQLAALCADTARTWVPPAAKPAAGAPR